MSLMVDDEPRLTVEYKTTQPIELLDLTSSLMAVGEQYKKYVTTAGFDISEENVRLYIKEIRELSG